MITPEIAEYVESRIIPEYNYFDKAHGLRHVRRVIENSMEISAGYDVNEDMAYVIAAYHDIGMKNGRENHEKNSSAFLVSDKNLTKWFSADEILVMAEAVEDHRASSNREPRSIYGKIVSEADRDIEYDTILTRTIQYGLSSFPLLSYEEHYRRVYEHIQNKYGESGYLKLWLNTGKNARNLARIREALKSEEIFQSDFNRIFHECSK